jgi:hypothetical protein
MYKTINKYAPKLFELMDLLPDKRKGSDYELSAVITGCIAMFVFKETSRNAFNQDMQEANFKDNYYRIFKKRLPHMDTVQRVISELPAKDIERIKQAFVAALIEQRLLRSFRLFGKYYTIAIDGTGVSSYKENNAAQNLPCKTSKNDVVTYYSHVVEAKLVTSSGICLSIASEWVVNQPEHKSVDKEFEKQDCEQKAFVRLAQKIKTFYPRLPICLLADGLYPNQTFMQICQDNDWAYIVVLKDKSLKTLQEDITDVENKHRHSIEYTKLEAKGKRHVHQQYEWITDTLAHSGHTVYWLSCTETIIHLDNNGKVLSEDEPTRFVNLTSIKVDKGNVRTIADTGRMRWKIENEGFNAQKNGGYNLGHKYARKSFTAHQNYYQCMQIAHIINQLVEKSTEIVALLNENKKLTIKHLWKQLLATMTSAIVNITEFEQNRKTQIRLAG